MPRHVRSSRPTVAWRRAALALAVIAGAAETRADAEPEEARPLAPIIVETTPMQADGASPIRVLADLSGLSAAQLEGLYRRGTVGPVPAGRVRGLALYPDSRFPRAKSRAARVAWQGKVFDATSGTATNRFFGLPIIKGNVYSGQSWLDGGAALILDYQDTSKVYGSYRDEIRQVGPGLYLGLMYDRSTNPPGFKMYFAFADQ